MEPATTTELRFRYGQASAAELQEIVDEVLAELRDETSEAAERAQQARLDRHVLAGADVTVHEDQGLDAASTTILVSITVQVGSHVAKKLWDDIIWPKVRRRLGGKAVGDETE